MPAFFIRVGLSLGRCCPGSKGSEVAEKKQRPIKYCGIAYQREARSCSACLSLSVRLREQVNARQETKTEPGDL